jgi:hypothetical protein
VTHIPTSEIFERECRQIMAVQSRYNRLQVSLTSRGARHHHMTHSSEPLPQLDSTPLGSTPRDEHREVLILADVCFEMFSMKELRRPHLILDELVAAFPDFDEPQILRAISMALHWRLVLRAAGRPLH